MKTNALRTTNGKDFTFQKRTDEFRWPFKTMVMVLLAISLLALLLAPAQMPADYSWIRHTTSESAAQGVQGAWLARLGFMLFGLMVIWLAQSLREEWPTAVRWMQAAFGVFMVGAAVFSKRAWRPEAAYDPVEDALHSFAATAMGFAFTIGVVANLLRRDRDRFGRVIDLSAAVAAVVIPLAMLTLPEWDGLMQRGMFIISYLWFGFEALRSHR
ncbi:MAG TPA: DUF998 domain-containing protein [Blastocatellia bacterium]|nr:DUF998 domain-containing protein [Blastocatellia bacterium]